MSRVYDTVLKAIVSHDSSMPIAINNAGSDSS
jgi:hypothetical protein